MEVAIPPRAVALNGGIEQIEAHMLNLPQADCPVTHRFGPGIYIREVTLPAGIIAIGHKQKCRHLNIMIKGKVAILNGDNVTVLEAPLIFESEPGRKVGYIMETTVWQNVYATQETDVEKLESMYLEKSITWSEHEKNMAEFRKASRACDIEDYYQMLKETGFDEPTVRSQSEFKGDQVPMPVAFNHLTSVRESDIEGKGLFLNHPVPIDFVIAPARISGMRTPAGRYPNHSKTPNCRFVKLGNGDIMLVSNHAIKGCEGGSKGQELTVNYRQALAISGGK